MRLYQLIIRKLSSLAQLIRKGQGCFDLNTIKSNRRHLDNNPNKETFAEKNTDYNLKKRFVKCICKRTTSTEAITIIGESLSTKEKGDIRLERSEESAYPRLLLSRQGKTSCYIVRIMCLIVQK